MKPNSQIGWGLYNGGLLCSVSRRKYQARMKAEVLTGEPWSKCRQYFEIHKVRVTALEGKDD